MTPITSAEIKVSLYDHSKWLKTLGRDVPEGVRLLLSGRAFGVHALFSLQDLRGAVFDHSSLTHANFTGANLEGALFLGADLSSADFTGANLLGAEFWAANLTVVKGMIVAGYPNGFLAYGWLREGWLSLRIGCREKRLFEARKYWKTKPHRSEVRAAVEYIAAIAKARGWPLREPR